MTLQNLIEEERDEAREEGYTTGVEEGYATGIKEGHEAGVKEGHEAGIKEGHEVGVAEGQIAGNISVIRKMSNKGYDAAMIADILEQETAYVENIYALLQKYPEYTDLEIAVVCNKSRE